MNVTCGLRTPSVPPEKIVTADLGMRGSQTCVLRVREKSLTHPLPVVHQSCVFDGSWQSPSDLPMTANISSRLYPSASSFFNRERSAGDDTPYLRILTEVIVYVYESIIGSPTPLDGDEALKTKTSPLLMLLSRRRRWAVPNEDATFAAVFNTLFKEALVPNTRHLTKI